MIKPEDSATPDAVGVRSINRLGVTARERKTMSMAQRYAGFLARVANDAATPVRAEAIRQAAKKLLDMEQEQTEFFMAGVLCALDVVYLHDDDPCSTLAVEIVDACGHDLVAFAKNDEYHNLDKLRKTDRAAARL